jgi:hypothetical protein
MGWYGGYYSGYKNDNFKIYSYNGYKANASKFKAMCVKIGNYKLYYSYEILICFETLKDSYISQEKHSSTTGNHRWSARNSSKNVHYVDQNVLELIALTTLLKMPFEEAKDLAGIRCERVHYP